MITFHQWLHNLPENRIRTGLGIYPDLYAVGQYPPLYAMPYSSTAGLAFQTTHKSWADKFKKHRKKKKRSKHKKKKSHE
jgi:hypothetical protein